MEALIPEAEIDPEAWLNDIASRAKREETLCGDGVMVWHVWGEGIPIILLHGGHGASVSYTHLTLPTIYSV